MTQFDQLKGVPRQSATSLKVNLLEKIDPALKGIIKQRSNEKLRFSFKLFDRDHKAFNLGDTTPEWFVTLLDALQDLSTLTWTEVKETRRSTYDPHPYTWSKCNFKFDFEEQSLNQFDAFQLRLDKSNGRIHGFLVGNIYYIYWLDPHHNMSDSPGYGSVEYYKPVLTLYDKILNENKQLKEENAIFKGDIEAFEDLLEKCED